MICDKCGYNNRNGANYCKKCGNNLYGNNPIPSNNHSSSTNTSLIILAVAIIAVVVLGSLAFIFLFDNQDADFTDDIVQNNSVSSNAENDDLNVVDNSNQLRIISGTITTGSSSSDKSSCMVFVGEEHAGEKVQISTLYSSDGDNLNPGKLVPKTVDSQGYVTVRSANGLKYYPDEVFIRIYDSAGNLLDSKTVYLDLRSGTQSF